MTKEPTDKLLPLSLAQYCKEKKLPVVYLEKIWGLKNALQKGVACIEQPYTRMDGTVGAPRFRFANRKLSPPQSGNQIFLYGQKQLLSQTQDVILVEGESDTQTLHFCGYNVLGIPGTSMWETCLKNDPNIAEFLAFKTVYVIQEPQSAAERAKHLDSPARMIAKIKQTLVASTVIPVKLWEFAPKDEEGHPVYKDVSGLFTYHGRFSKFDSALEIAIKAAGRAVEKSPRQIQFVLASSVEMEITRWLWYEHIPVGDLTVFAGMPQKGKSTAAIDVVARLTTGRDFPGSFKQIDACEVAILASEDNPKTTTVPRLVAAQADIAKVLIIKGSEDGTQEWEIALDQDLERLRTFLDEHPAIKLIVMDPVTSYIGDVDPNKPKEVRPFLNKLKQFAEEMHVSLLLIMHLSKNPDVSALHRVGGAATWIEVPRSVWFFDVKQQDDETAPPVYVMVNGKLNIVADERKRSLEYTFAGVEVDIKGVMQSMGTIQWGGESDVTLEQQYNRKDKPGPTPVKTEAAQTWLQQYLAAGPRLSADVFGDGHANGHKKDTLYEAKNRLGVEAVHMGRSWAWKLPEPSSGS